MSFKVNFNTEKQKLQALQLGGCLLCLPEETAIWYFIERTFKVMEPALRIGSIEVDQIHRYPRCRLGFPGGSSGKEPTSQAGEVRDGGSIPRLGRSAGEGHSNPLQYSCLEKPMDSGGQ